MISHHRFPMSANRANPQSRRAHIEARTSLPGRRNGTSSCEQSVADSRPTLAFTLIEMVGILAVIAILAVVLIPVFIKQLDQLAADKEVRQLKAFADGLKQQIIKTRYIPDQTAWDSMISSN